MKVRKMKRLRILILALCVCLIAGVAETLNMVDAYGSEHNNHLICGDTTCTNAAHDMGEDAVAPVWTAWEGTSNIDYGDNNTAYVYLTQDVEGKYAGVNVNQGKTLYLCLNGHKIKRMSNNSDNNGIINISDNNKGGTLILCDCQNTGVITHDKNSENNTYNGAGVFVYGSSCKFIMYGGTISGNNGLNGTNGGGVYVTNGGTFEMRGGTISGNTVTGDGGGVYAISGSKLQIYGGTINGNIAGTDGGGISITGCSFSVYGGIISDNTASGNGGGLCVYNLNPTLTGGEIKSNNAQNGGGIYMNNNTSSGSSTLNISNGVNIGQNTATDNGGGLYIRNTTVNMTGGSISSNSSKVGGGVYIDEDKGRTFNMTGSSCITNNTVTVGGGVYVSGVFKISDNVNISGNKKGESDSNVYLPSGKKITIANTLNDNAKIGVTTKITPAENECVAITDFCTSSRVKMAAFTYENDSDIRIATNTKNNKIQLVACNHDYDTNWISGDDGHWHKCKNCDTADAIILHTFDQEAVGEQYKLSAATCTGKAVYYKSCVCGKVGIDTFEYGNILGHSLTKVDAVSATCTADGNIEYYTCSNCNKWFSDADATTEITDKSSVNIPATGHSFSVTSDENQHWWKCSKCNAEKDRANHSGGTATCAEKAVCTTCNSEYGALNPNNHVGGREIRNALDADHNNQTAGYTGDTYCKGCNRELEKGSIISPTPHIPGDDWGKDKHNHWKVCSVAGCSAILETATHTGGEPIEENIQAATCTNDGSYDEVIYCEICHYEMSRVNKTLDALGHTWSNWSVTAPATCTVKGSEERTCNVCNAKETRDIEIVPHTVSTDWRNDADNHWKICTECKAIVVDKEAHKWKDGVITTPATTTAEGVKTFTCEVCKATKTESVPKIPSGGGVITPPKTDTITADVTGDKTSVKITAEISGDTASIAEIGKNDIDKAGAGVDIIIDLTVIPNEVVSVTVTKKSLDNIYESKSDNVSIKLTGSTVNMDRDTLKNIIDQMKGSDLKLVVDKHQEALESMNKVQQDAVKDMREPKIMDAYFISGGIRITDFKGGSVDIKIPYPDKKGVKAWYIDDNGIKEPVPVSYDGKNAVITVNHFSHYVLEEDDSDNVEPVPVKKTVDKVIYVKSAKYSKKTGTEITFNKVSGADGYYVYGNRCNTDKVYKFKKLATLKGNDNTVFVHKKTAKNTFYKYYIKAYKVVDGKRVTVSRSEEIHFVTDVKGYKYGNPTKVTLSVKKYTLSKGKTFNLKNRVKVYSSKKVLLHTDKIRYVSSDSSIAKVNSKGKITAKKAGSCNIYAIAQNGKAAKIAVTVK